MVFEFGSYIHNEWKSEQIHIKNFGEKGAWAYLETAQRF